MNSKAFIFLAFAIISCGQTKKEKTVAESLVEKMELHINAASSTMVEVDEMSKDQRVLHILSIEFTGCKNIDLMDSSLRAEMKVLAQGLKNNIPGSERIEKYKIVLLKDPNDSTPSKSGFNIKEKGFTFSAEELN